MPKETVFVYGSLRRGFCNHHLLDGRECLGPAATAEPHPLCIDGHGWPVLGRGPGPCPARGEVYRVDAACLARLDALEGHPDDYLREPAPVILDKGEAITAWVYFHPRAHGDPVPTGDYADHPSAGRCAP